MFSLLLTVFIVSVIAMFVMVIRKAIAIRGLPQAPAKPFILDATPHPHRIRSFIKEISKEGVHIILLTLTKGWLLIEKEWKRMLKKRFPKMHNALYEYPEIGERTTSSFFLATITEYKEKTKRLRERIKKDDLKPRKPRTTKAIKDISDVLPDEVEPKL
ncbi:MAG: hypothetical protein KBB70_01915 [Candidatus Pacebacteria bacterium]|nr:hypothetical protein [Candidatus Paceibacterota bacterium]